MPDNGTAKIDIFMQALFLLSLLLYIVPAALGPGSRERVRWMRRAAIVTLAIGFVVALAASARWFWR